MSILNELEELVRSAESTKKREKQMLDMFKLAGYQMNINPDDIEGPNGPKDVIELLREALGNPPEDAGKWIRISDIPRFIKDNLVIPEDLQSWNDKVLTENVTAKEKPKVMRLGTKGFSFSENTDPISEPNQISQGQYYSDTVGAIWCCEDKGQDKWSLEGDSDKGGYYSVDAFNYGPLTEVVKVKASEPQLVKRSRVL